MIEKEKDELDLFNSLIKFIAIGIFVCYIIGTMIFVVLL